MRECDKKTDAPGPLLVGPGVGAGSVVGVWA